MPPTAVLGPQTPVTQFAGYIPIRLPDVADTPPPELSNIDGYELLEIIGAGGMGVVVRARHRKLNRIVALKMLGPDSLGSPVARQRFQAEAETVARLQHPNIIQVFDVGQLGGTGGKGANPYLSLEYVDGGSLYKRTQSPQPPAEAVRLMEKVARAVHAAHLVGVVHRDLKPANILLTGDGEPKVADFGLAKQMQAARDENGHPLTQHGMAVGTPEYMAPEQVDGAPPTAAFDIHALGVILYELLTARVPFKGTTVTDTMLLVKCQEPVSPRRLQPNLPRDLETICLKCLEKEPQKRYATAEALADDLARWQSGLPILARPVSGPERLCRWAKRNPAVALMTAVAVLVAAAGVGGVAWEWRQAERHARAAEASAEEARDHRRAERWEVYRANVAVAAAALERNATGTARRALDLAPVEHRNWEWNHYHQLLDTTRQEFPFLGDGVIGVSTSENPPRFVIRQPDQLQVWDVSGGPYAAGTIPPADSLGWLAGPGGRGYAFQRGANEVVVRKSSDGVGDIVITEPSGPIFQFRVAERAARVFTATATGRVRVWDADTGRQLVTFQLSSAEFGICPSSPDGSLLTVHDTVRKTIQVWDTATGRELHAVAVVTNLLQVRFDPSGERLLVNNTYPEAVIHLCDARTGKSAVVLRGHTNSSHATAFSPDGRLLATASLDQTARVWDARTGREMRVLHGHTGAVHAVAFSPDGRYLATGAEDQSVRLWDATSGLLLAVHRGHQKAVLGVAWAADGETVTSVSRDQTVRTWDARPQALGVRRGHSEFVYDVAYLPDGRIVSASWDGTARLWDADGRDARRFDHGAGTHVYSLAVHSAGRWLATVARDDFVRLWDINTGALLHKWAVRAGHWKSGRIAFHPTSDLIACGCPDGVVRLMDAGRRGEVMELTGHRDAVRSVAFSPDGRWLATGGADGDKTIRVWDVARRKLVQVLTKHSDTVYALAFSRDGTTLASGSEDGTVQLWDTANWTADGTLPLGVKVYGLAFSADGRRLACGCADNALRLWDVARRQEVAELRGHADYVHAVAFNQAGDQLVSASGDKTVRVWHTVPVRDRGGRDTPRP